MIKVNAIGDTCPIPVVKTKNAIKELNGSGEVQTLVDNEIAVQNLTKMANQKGYAVKSEKLSDGNFSVTMTIGEASVAVEECAECIPDSVGNVVVAITSKFMGTGDEKLGATLIKGFIFALTQLDELPKTILFYNGGAHLTCEDSPALEDLKSLEAQGVEILTCGTCLDFYGLKDKLAVGGVTNMYAIAEKMMQASHIIKP
jgi:selenium metabolism protein YedF